ncbi:hypothetical protein SAMN05444392_104108 [Seinonella peptonophila]|uniref:histidine kinase n=1 Tax=Seinonella peptonophila TaxID=112248 RepID=A0A1M4X4K8_9BACL|nr:histidine kinase [Seinonella peptonophila]SHE88132.1 hypothetical protein SAMN05444392_104108 [Seinonella peptonophila]
MIAERITLKGIILIFIILHTIQVSLQDLPKIILALLIMICINLGIEIVKDRRWKLTLLIVSTVVSFVLSQNVYQWLILFIPIHICEYIFEYIKQKWVQLIILIAPFFFISTRQEQFIFGLILIFSLIIFQMRKQYEEHLLKHETINDQLRHESQVLKKQLILSNQYLKQSEYTIKLEERNRLSQMIHDQVGHAIAGSLIQLKAMKMLKDSDQEKATELLQNAIHILSEGLDTIRATLKNIKPKTEQLGIHQIRLMLDKFSSTFPLQNSFHFQGNIEKISAIHWKIIYENLVECLTNTMKYSKATTVSVKIHVLNKLIKIEMKDNGVGVSKVKKGLGIQGMEERAAKVHGTIIVDGSHGFSVTMLFPL